jgi:hypothetical protein
LRSGLALPEQTHVKVEVMMEFYSIEASGLNLWEKTSHTFRFIQVWVKFRTVKVYMDCDVRFLFGTESLVMSLWSVSDYTTREIMTNYYKTLSRA